MKNLIFMCVAISLLASCRSENIKQQSVADEEAKHMFQGIWLDDDSEIVLLRAAGDTIYYADVLNAPVRFQIKTDSLFLYGSELTRYKIDKQSEHAFWFHSLSGDVVKLHKSENAEDSLAFVSKEVQVIPIYKEVIQRDSIVFFQGHRYRAYTYINPSQMKVYKTSFSEEGISVDNVYYDNVIHICVYKGKKCLYAQDITKKMFANLIPEEFLSQAILSDMDFVGVSSEGFLYRASVCIPETVVCYLVDLKINKENKLVMDVVR